MRRNRLILGSRCAVGAVFLVLPGLLVWAAGPPPKETPPTGRSKSCVEDGCHAKE